MRRKEMKKVIVSVYCALLTAITVVTTPVYMYASETEQVGIVVDGQLDDWAYMRDNEVRDSEISSLEYMFAKSEDGSMLYYYFLAPTINEWDSSYDWKYLDFKIGETSMTAWLHNIADAWANPGANGVRKNTAHGSNAGVIVYEGALPVSTDDITITFQGEVITFDDIQVYVSAEKAEVSYKGITIDGDYYDWAAVEKVEARCSEEAGHNYECLSKAAVMFDGDYVYLYLQDGESGNAAGAGVRSNGRYSIVTDTGRTLLFEINTTNGGTIAGVEGAEISYFGNEWEISIPVSELPLYIESISFGLYQETPFVTGVVDIQGGEGSAGSFSGITYDGLFGDWSAYPHTLIQYATSGTLVNNADGEGALYHEDALLYGHVVTTMENHLQDGGGEFLHAVSIYFNGDHEYNGNRTNNLYPRFITVAEDGTIDWNAQTKNLENGVYEFYIADSRGEYDTKNITNVSQLPEHEKFFGKIMVNITDSCNEMEFYVDLEQVAKYLSHYSGRTVDASEFQLIEAQFAGIGNEIISTAGTSSGPYVGIVICVAVVVVTYIKKKRSNKAVA